MPFVDLAALDRLTQGQSPLQKPRKIATREAQSHDLVDDPTRKDPETTQQEDVKVKWMSALH